MDEHFSHLFVAKIGIVFEKTKINEKEPGVGPLFLKNCLFTSFDDEQHFSHFVAADFQQMFSFKIFHLRSKSDFGHNLGHTETCPTPFRSF